MGIKDIQKFEKQIEFAKKKKEEANQEVKRFGLQFL